MIRVTGSGTPEQFAAIRQRMTATSPSNYHLATAIPFESNPVVG